MLGAVLCGVIFIAYSVRALMDVLLEAALQVRQGNNGILTINNDKNKSQHAKTNEQCAYCDRPVGARSVRCCFPVKAGGQLCLQCKHK